MENFTRSDAAEDHSQAKTALDVSALTTRCAPRGMDTNKTCLKFDIQVIRLIRQDKTRHEHKILPPEPDNKTLGASRNLHCILTAALEGLITDSFTVVEPGGPRAASVT